MPNIRIDAIVIKDFKNVKYGEIDFSQKKPKSNANILALYGQNGSGKTALIDFIEIVKCAISGRRVPKNAYELISFGSSNASFMIKFSLTDLNKITYMHYSFSLKKEVGLVEDKNPYYSVIYDESLLISIYENDKCISRLSPVIDTTKGEPFGPQTKYNELIKDKEKITDVIVAKKMAYKSGTSFIFSNDFLNIIADASNDSIVKSILLLKDYGNRNLFVLSVKDSALISFDALPLAFRIENEGFAAIGKIGIPIDGNGLIPYDFLDLLKKIIKNMNIVLEQIIPGLNVDIRELGEDYLKDNTKGIRIQFVSKRGESVIALKYESEGIKKIISILQLLIVIFNNPTVTVAIDELDSGIFEYLLGELIRIISDHGKGQLIFTSHNLRPLETIDKRFVAFTTVNPNNRYIRFTNIKTTNNLRDFYYRDIVLGEQEEPVYEPTSNRKIAFAFIEAGDFSGE